MGSVARKAANWITQLVTMKLNRVLSYKWAKHAIPTNSVSIAIIATVSTENTTKMFYSSFLESCKKAWSYFTQFSPFVAACRTGQNWPQSNTQTSVDDWKTHKVLFGGFLFPPKPTRPNWSFILTNLQLQSTDWSRVCKNGKASNLRIIKYICVCSVIWASSALPCVAAVSPQGKLGFAGWPWCLFFSTTSQLEDELAPRHLWLWDPSPFSSPLLSCFVWPSLANQCLTQTLGFRDSCNKTLWWAALLSRQRRLQPWSVSCAGEKTVVDKHTGGTLVGGRAGKKWRNEWQALPWLVSRFFLHVPGVWGRKKLH